MGKHIRARLSRNVSAVCVRPALDKCLVKLGPIHPRITCILLYSGQLLSYVVHFISATICSRELKFLQIIYESFDCDLTQGDRSWFQ